MMNFQNECLMVIYQILQIRCGHEVATCLLLTIEWKYHTKQHIIILAAYCWPCTGDLYNPTSSHFHVFRERFAVK